MSEGRLNPGISQSNTQNQAQISTQAPNPNSARDQLQAQDEHLDAHAAVLINQFLGKARRVATSELGGDFRCTICSEGFLRGENPEVPIRLDCGHVFGMSCILKWLSPLSRSGNNNCPNCRAKIFDNWDSADFPIQENSASRRRRDTTRFIQTHSLREGQSRRRFEDIDETQNPGQRETNVPAPRRDAPIRRQGTPDPIEIAVETVVREREEATQRVVGLVQRIAGRLDVTDVGETDGTPVRRPTVPSRMTRAPGPTENPERQREDTMQQIDGRSDVGGVRQVEYDAVREAARYALTRGPRIRLRPRAPRRLGEGRVRQSSTDSTPLLTRLEGPTEGQSIEPGAARRPTETTTSTSPEVVPSVDRPSHSSSTEGIHQSGRDDAPATIGPGALRLQNPDSTASLRAESNERGLASSTGNERDTDEARQQELLRRLNISLEEVRRINAERLAIAEPLAPAEAAPVAIDLASSTGSQRENDEARRQELRRLEILRRLSRNRGAARRVTAERSAIAEPRAPAEAAPVAIEDDNGVASMFTAAETEHDLQRQQEATTKRKHHMWMQFCEGVVRTIEQSPDDKALSNHDLALTIINMANLDEFIAERASESPTWRRILQTFPRLHTEMVTRFNDFRPLTSVNIDHRIHLERLLSSTNFHLPAVHKARWHTRLSERLARVAASSNHDAAVARLTERVAHLSSPFRENESITWPEGTYDGTGEHFTSEEGRQMQRMEDYLLGRTPVGVRREGAASAGAALRVGAERSFAMTVVARL
ncbi:hypothetical protein BDR22DRAFT_637998 [Usnea florida]